MIIKSLYAYEILDSRGLPTVEVRLTLEDGAIFFASAPAGSSQGSLEAVELRDGDKKRFRGNGVLRAVHHVNMILAPALESRDCDVVAIDEILVSLDGTNKKETLGANAILPISLVVARGQAHANGIKLYELLAHIAGVDEISFPYCLFNILNGGVHARNGLAFQEFMIIPRQFESMGEMLSIAQDVYQALFSLLQKSGYTTTVGDEGGFAPIFSEVGIDRERRALDFVTRAIQQAGYEVDEVSLAVDVAVSQYYNAKTGIYRLYDKDYDAATLIALYDNLVQEFPVISLEDGMAENDNKGWRMLTKQLGDVLQLVGDDVFVTCAERIEMGIELGMANSVLIKPNQVGTLSETLAAIAIAQSNGYGIVVSHRSGETNDDFIADLVVGVNGGQLKAGAPVHGERVAKYNRLLAIERDCLAAQAE